jgi:predicted DCC family thiol-disulfide oxidoreductase YuxK
MTEENRLRILIFDGDCGFCGRVVTILRRRDRCGIFDYIPYQSLSDGELATFELTRDQCGLAIQCVTDHGVSNGAMAFNAYLSHFGLACKALGLIGSLPLVRLAESVAYEWIARNRHHISEFLGMRVCQIEPPPGTVG